MTLLLAHSVAPLVMPERGLGSRQVVEQALQKAGVRLAALKIVVEPDSTEAILSAVEEELGGGVRVSLGCQHERS